MPDAALVPNWLVGPGRPATWPRLPLPGHRTMGEVLAAERKRALERGAIAFARARKMEEQDDGPT